MLIIKRNTTKNLVYLENNKFQINQHIVLGCDKTVTVVGKIVLLKILKYKLKGRYSGVIMYTF